jgi:hypothetical protein
MFHHFRFDTQYYFYNQIIFIININKMADDDENNKKFTWTEIAIICAAGFLMLLMIIFAVVLLFKGDEVSRKDKAYISLHEIDVLKAATCVMNKLDRIGTEIENCAKQNPCSSVNVCTKSAPTSGGSQNCPGGVCPKK